MSLLQASKHLCRFNARSLPTNTRRQLHSRHTTLLWTEEELVKLIQAVKDHGYEWEYIQDNVFHGTRSARQLSRKYDLWEKRLESNPILFWYSAASPAEDEALKELVQQQGVKTRLPWTIIAEKFSKNFPERLPETLADRWRRLSANKRGKYSDEEDQLIRDFCKENGGSWARLSVLLNRPQRSLRAHHADLQLKEERESWSLDEHYKICAILREHGPIMNKIEEAFPHRSKPYLKLLVKKLLNKEHKYEYNRGSWFPAEVKALKEACRRYTGTRGLWRKVSAVVKSRNDAQCMRYVIARGWNNFVDT
ncbi:5717_t:CDS:1 [Paraglomus occultum]|uniref:5717_t:CDS:1 n=1 Tax=Paraglomus occultum TaxID=144539 RepID=A0A9N8VV33_9GLOM|nr:5717_t:CDS:1 [Paraglomus occultum]